MPDFTMLQSISICCQQIGFESITIDTWIDDLDAVVDQREAFRIAAANSSNVSKRLS